MLTALTRMPEIALDADAPPETSPVAASAEDIPGSVPSGIRILSQSDEWVHGLRFLRNVVEWVPGYRSPAHHLCVRSKDQVSYTEKTGGWKIEDVLFKGNDWQNVPPPESHIPDVLQSPPDDGTGLGRRSIRFA